MVDAISAAIGFMTTDLARMTVIGQNLANVSTAGYRTQVPVSMAFTDYLATGSGQAYAASMSSMQLVEDFRPGRVQATGNPLDFAIEGDGFFEIATSSGSQFTRQGNFQLDATGRIVNEAGFAVAGDGGEIIAKSNHVTVDSQGDVAVESCPDAGKPVPGVPSYRATLLFDRTHRLIGAWYGNPFSDFVAPRFGPRGEAFAIGAEIGTADPDGPILKLNATLPGG